MVCRCHWVFMFLYFHFQVAVKRLSETLVLLRHQIIQTTILCLWIACMLFASPTAVLSHSLSHTLTWSPQKVRVKWHFFVFVFYTTGIERKIRSRVYIFWDSVFFSVGPLTILFCLLLGKNSLWFYCSSFRMRLRPHWSFWRFGVNRFQSW